MRVRSALALMWAWLFAGCPAELKEVNATEVVVRIDAEPDVLGALASLRVRVAREQDAQWVERNDQTFERADLRWPVDIVVVPRSEAEADLDFEIVIDALADAGDPVVQHRALTSFVPRETRILRVLLARCGDQALGFVCEDDAACLGPTCQTCVDDRCQSVPRSAPESLAPFEPPPEMSVGLVAGDATDDAQVHAEPDAAVDAGSAEVVACARGTRADDAGGCVDVDECTEQLDDCDDAPEACVNLLNAGYQCTCPSGYGGNGRGANGCMDIDECMTGAAQCGSLAACANVDGSYKCGDCPAGYRENPSGGCADVNECLSENGGCDSNPMASCNNQMGAANTCSCPAGYTGNGRGSEGCVDIDECAPKPCANGGTCANRVNEYACTCAVGFSGPRCLTDACNPNPCQTGYTCTRSMSGASCRPTCATTSSRCAAGQSCATSADCGSGLTCDNTDRTCLQTCTGPLTVTSRDSLTDIRFCREVQGDLVLAPDFPQLSATDLPYLTRVTGALRDSFAAGLTALELPALRSVGSLTLSSGGNVLLPALTQAGGSVEIVFSQTRIEMPALSQVGGFLHIGSGNNLTRIDLRALTTIGGNLHFNDLPSLTSLNISALNRVTGNLTVTVLIRLPYPSISRLNDAETGLDRVSGAILIEDIGCCLITLPPENRYACSGSTGC
jgi:hypothetical protein